MLAILYFLLMELILIDSSRALHEAQRFRARVVAAALAENAAELAATNMVGQYTNDATLQDAQGSMHGTYSRNGENFEIFGEATTAGVITERATVFLEGRVTVDGTVKIEWSRHSQ